MGSTVREDIIEYPAARFTEKDYLRVVFFLIGILKTLPNCSNITTLVVGNFFKHVLTEM